METINRTIGVQRLTITFSALSQVIIGIMHVIVIWMAALMINGDGGNYLGR